MIDFHSLNQVRGLITRAEGEHLAHLASEAPPWSAIVEIGSHTGRSTLYLAAGAREGGSHVTAVDPWPDPGYTAHYDGSTNDDPFDFKTGQAVFEAFCDNMTAAEAWPQVTVLRAPSLEVARVWVNPVGLLFLDAMHGYPDVLADCEAWLDKVTPGGMVALHDWYGDPEYTKPSEVAQAFDDADAAQAFEHVVQVDNLWVGRRL